MKKRIILILILILLIVLFICSNKKKIQKFTNTGDNRKQECLEFKNEYLKKDFQIFNNFLSKEECERIINENKDKKFNKSTVIDKKTGDHVISKARTSENIFLNIKDNKFLKNIAERISKITNLPIQNFEDFQLVKYDPPTKTKAAQFYRPHYDQKDDIEKNKRYKTFFIYLNDVDKGGHTIFPNLDKKVKPEQGKAVLWNNLFDKSKLRHPCSLHGGTAPEGKDMKWGINVWIRENKY